MARPIVPPEINVTNRPAPLIVGRDPGSTESARGRPFIGDAGRLFFGGYDNYTGTQTQGVLAHAGLTREDVNITNRVLRQPPNNDFFRHSWDDINDGHDALFALIEELQPSIIIPTGAQACYDLVPGWRTLTDRYPDTVNSGGKSIKSAKGILDRRGFIWYEHDLPCDAPVLATLHPASCLYQAMPNRLLLEIDMQRAGAVIRGELPRRPWPEPKHVSVSSDLAPLWEADLVAYDIEVKWGGTAFLCIAFYTSDGQAFLAYEDALGACEAWLRSDCRKLAHNGQFDRYYIEEKLGIPVGGRHEDTIVGHWSCYPELAGKEDTGREDQKKKNKNEMTRKGLNFLASFHLNVPWWKTYTSDPALMGQLCVNDVAATMWAWEVIEPEIEEMNVRLQYERQLAKIPALIAIQRRGFRIDEDLRAERIAKLEERQERLAEQSTQAGLEFLRAYNLTHNDDGEEYWWYHDARCECCFGGDVKSAHCTSCAGITGSGSGGSILRNDLLLWAWRSTDVPKAELDNLKKDELAELIPPCAVCDGRGTIPTWDFNPMSPVQMPEVLWGLLDAPKYTGPPAADEETLRKVLEWAEEMKPDA